MIPSQLTALLYKFHKIYWNNNSNGVYTMIKGSILLFLLHIYTHMCMFVHENYPSKIILDF